MTRRNFIMSTTQFIVIEYELCLRNSLSNLLLHVDLFYKVFTILFTILQKVIDALIIEFQIEMCSKLVPWQFLNHLFELFLCFKHWFCGWGFPFVINHWKSLIFEHGTNLLKFCNGKNIGAKIDWLMRYKFHKVQKTKVNVLLCHWWNFYRQKRDRKSYFLRFGLPPWDSSLKQLPMLAWHW